MEVLAGIVGSKGPLKILSATWGRPEKIEQALHV
jgi:hypothetical protein